MSKRLDYHKMVQRVLAVDEAAAKYLLDKDIKTIGGYKRSGDLESCFLFGDSPQGFEYWSNIYKKIGSY